MWSRSDLEPLRDERAEAPSSNAINTTRPKLKFVVTAPRRNWLGAIKTLNYGGLPAFLRLVFIVDSALSTPRPCLSAGASDSCPVTLNCLYCTTGMVTAP